ncbi:MAG: lipoate--protein ligase family protein [Candidatus Zixiibacteriota bacterium]
MGKHFFFSHFEADPYFNMAFDEWLLARVLAQPGTVYLRLYTWRPGAITFGYNQKQESALDFTRLGETPVIRRITGGRAIYHDPSEYTYAVALNPLNLENKRLVGTLSETSGALAAALVHFLTGLGVQAAFVQRSSRENARPDFFHKAPCFASKARYELMVGEKKIIASAQKRHEGSLLQHGSIKINGLMSHPALNGCGEGAKAVKQPVAMKEFNETATLFRIKLEEHLGMNFQEGKLTAREVDEIKKIEEAVKKNALKKRVVFKQFVTVNSL